MNVEQYVGGRPRTPDGLLEMLCAGSFDLMFGAEGLRVIKTPVRAPMANAVCERWIGTLRRECLDWIVIAHRRQLEAVLQE
jgi:transposase InsO family protein